MVRRANMGLSIAAKEKIAKSRGRQTVRGCDFLRRY
jgi:hypothetical protein